MLKPCSRSDKALARQQLCNDRAQSGQGAEFTENSYASLLVARLRHRSSSRMLPTRRVGGHRARPLDMPGPFSAWVMALRWVARPGPYAMNLRSVAEYRLPYRRLIQSEDISAARPARQQIACRRHSDEATDGLPGFRNCWVENPAVQLGRDSPPSLMGRRQPTQGLA